MAKTCNGSAENERRHVALLPDNEIMGGISAHANPEWWKTDVAKNCNQAYLRRWGSHIRREARKRGLL